MGIDNEHRGSPPDREYPVGDPLPSPVTTRPTDGAEPVERGTAGLPTRFGHIPALDGLRAVAVLTVLGYHFGAGWLPGGFLGVDTFFVLSGYLITSLLLVEWGRSGGTDLGAFWIRRARRLLPALFLVLVVVAIWAAIAWPADRLGSVRSDSLWTLFYGANWHFIFTEQSYFDLVSAASPLRHAWSLAIEEQFYLVWPLIFVGLVRLGRGSTRWLVGLSVVGTAASIWAMAAYFTEGDPSRAYYGTDSRAHGLLIGALLAVALARYPLGRLRPRHAHPGVVSRHGPLAIGLVGAAVMGVLFATAGDRSAWLYPWGFVVFELAVVAVIVAINAPGPSPLAAVLSWRPLRWVGAVSYGLYLWHWPVLVFLNEGSTRLEGFSLFLLRLGVTVGATTASYYLLEQPIRHGRWLHGWKGWAAAPVGFALAASVIVVSTRDAEPPPEFLVANPEEVLTFESDVPIPTTAPPTTAPAEPVDPAAPTTLPPREVGRVLMIGDSIAASVAPGMAQLATSTGQSFTASTLPGCSQITGLATPGPGEEPFPWSQACETETARLQTGLAATKQASTILWMSSWETSDRLVDGTFYEFGTPEADEVVLRLID